MKQTITIELELQQGQEGESDLDVRCEFSPTLTAASKFDSLSDEAKILHNLTNAAVFAALKKLTEKSEQT